MKSAFAVGVGLCLVGACSVDNGIEGSDTTYFPTVRAFIDSSNFEERDGSETRPPAEGTEEGPRYRTGMDISLTGAGGDFVPDGAVNAADYSMIEASVGWRGGVIIENQLTLELIGGLGYHYADIEGPGPMGLISDSEHRFGLLFGTQIGWEPITDVQLYGRATYLPLFFEAQSTQLEAGVQVNVVDEVGLLLAYRYWSFEAEDGDSPWSFRLFDGPDPIADIELSGLTFGFVLEF